MKFTGPSTSSIMLRAPLYYRTDEEGVSLFTMRTGLVKLDSLPSRW